ncbi:MAG: NUDIX hydrolase [Spirochaetales bacterium]
MIREEVEQLQFLRAALLRYRDRYPREAKTVGRFLDLLADGSAAFERGHLPGHFTASALVVDEPREHVLLTHHRKLGIWVQLGGHADGDLDLYSAAIREAQEESGLSAFSSPLEAETILDVDIHPIPAIGPEPEHLHFDVRFLLVADPSSPLVVSDESHDLKWVPAFELDHYSEEASLERAVAKALSVHP